MILKMCPLFNVKMSNIRKRLLFIKIRIIQRVVRIIKWLKPKGKYTKCKLLISSKNISTIPSKIYKKNKSLNLLPKSPTLPKPNLKTTPPIKYNSKPL